MVYTLAKYPDIQEKILTEIKTNLDTPDTPLTATLLKSFKYLDMVVKEVWRMYPSVNGIMRKVVKDVEISELTAHGKTSFVSGFVFEPILLLLIFFELERVSSTLKVLVLSYLQLVEIGLC